MSCCEHEEMWARSWRAALKMASRAVSDHEAAADLAQETLVVALRKPSAPLESRWLSGVVHNIARRFKRSECNRRRREVEAARRAAQAGEAGGRHRLAEDIERAVARLREPYRTVVRLRYYEEYAPAEIAEVLGVPGATVRTWLHRACLELRRRLDPVVHFPAEQGASRSGDWAEQPAASRRGLVGGLALLWPRFKAWLPPRGTAAVAVSRPARGIAWYASAAAVVVAAAAGLLVWAGAGENPARPQMPASAVAAADRVEAAARPVSDHPAARPAPAQELRAPAGAALDASRLAPRAALPPPGVALVVDAQGRPQPGVAIRFAGGVADVGLTAGAVFEPDGRKQELGASGENGELDVGALRGPGVLLASGERVATLFAGKVLGSTPSRPIVVVAAARRVAGAVGSDPGPDAGAGAGEGAVAAQLLTPGGGAFAVEDIDEDAVEAPVEAADDAVEAAVELAAERAAAPSSSPGAGRGGEPADADGQVPGSGAVVQLRVPASLYRTFPAPLSESVPWEPSHDVDAGSRFSFAGAPDIAGARLRVRAARGAAVHEVELPAGDQVGLTMPLPVEPAAAAALRGRVLDPRGVPQAGALVALGDALDVTDGDGAFDVELPAAVEGQAAASRGQVTVLAPGFAPVRVEVDLEQPRQPLTLWLARAAATLRGVVVDERGEPVVGAEVMFADEPIVAVGREAPVSAYDWTVPLDDANRSQLESGPEFYYRNARFRGRRYIYTDAEGRFEHAGLEHRPHEVVVVRHGTLEFSRHPQVDPAAGEAVLRFPATPRQAIGGWVRGTSGEPLANASVSLWRQTFTVSRGPDHPPVELTVSAGPFPTDVHGRFDCGSLPTEGVWIAVEHPDIGRQTWPLDARQPLHSLQVVVDRRVFVRVTAHGFDRCELLDALGVRLPMSRLTDSSFAGEQRYVFAAPLADGDSGLLAATEAVRTAVLWTDGVVAARVPVEAVPGALTQVIVH